MKKTTQNTTQDRELTDSELDEVAGGFTPVPIPGERLAFTPVPIPGERLAFTPVPIPRNPLVKTTLG